VCSGKKRQETATFSTCSCHLCGSAVQVVKPTCIKNRGVFVGVSTVRCERCLPRAKNKGDIDYLVQRKQFEGE